MPGWVGSTDKTDKSGVGVFEFDGAEHEIRFERFSDYYLINKMLDARYESGQKRAAESILAEITRVIRKHWVD
jgi:hypothetical protein